VHDNPGLCGDIVDVPQLGKTYSGQHGAPPFQNTNLGTACPSILPCCDVLRQNPIFCCMEARRPEFALSVCSEQC